MENTSSMDLAWGDGSSSNGSLRECWRATHACRVAQFLTGCGQVPVCVQGLGTLDIKYELWVLSHWTVTAIYKTESMKKNRTSQLFHRELNVLVIKELYDLISMDKHISHNLIQHFSLTFVQHFRASHSLPCPLYCLIFSIVFWCICGIIYNAVVRDEQSEVVTWLDHS